MLVSCYLLIFFSDPVNPISHRQAVVWAFINYHLMTTNEKAIEIR